MTLENSPKTPTEHQSPDVVSILPPELKERIRKEYERWGLRTMGPLDRGLLEDVLSQTQLVISHQTYSSLPEVISRWRSGDFTANEIMEALNDLLK